jgi:mannosidase alpha-like ER degradation enhancer 2
MKHVYRRPWYIEVDMMTGVQVWPIFNSLQAFWPGIQALFGHVSQARDTTLTFHSGMRTVFCI